MAIVTSSGNSLVQGLHTYYAQDVMNQLQGGLQQSQAFQNAINTQGVVYSSPFGLADFLQEEETKKKANKLFLDLKKHVLYGSMTPALRRFLAVVN